MVISKPIKAPVITDGATEMTPEEELAAANADLRWWMDIFDPLGYRIHGWTYRNSASVISPTGKYLSVDGKTLELIEACRKRAD